MFEVNEAVAKNKIVGSRPDVLCESAVEPCS